MWIQTKTGKRAETHADIRVLLNMRGPDVLTDDVIQSLGFAVVKEVSPSYDPLTQTATEIAPKIINGVYTQQWEVRNLTPEEAGRNLGAAIVNKREEINAAWLAADYAGFTYAGKKVDSDAVSRSRMDAVTGYISLFGTFPADWIGLWKAADNSYITMTELDQWRAMYQAMFDQGQANFRHAESLKVALAKAASAADIAAIRW